MIEPGIHNRQVKPKSYSRVPKVTGRLITLQSIAYSAAIELVAPRGVVTAAFGWVITAVMLGLALRQSASGWLVKHASVQRFFLTPTAASLILAALVWFRRATVRPQCEERNTGLVSATIESGVVAAVTGRRTSARTQRE